MKRLVPLVAAVMLCSCIDLRERTNAEDTVDLGADAAPRTDEGRVADIGDMSDMTDSASVDIGDMSESDLAPMPAILDDCNGQDDDADGEIDETSFDAPTTLNIEFSPRTYVGLGGSIEITDGAGEHIEGSPFTRDALADRSISVRGNFVQIRLYIIEGGDRAYGYEITQITDQDGRAVDYTPPEISREGDELLASGFDNTWSLTASDSQGGGVPCGVSNVGACRLGTLTCQEGSLTCVGEVQAEDSESPCDCLDNDCDGEIDEGEACTFEQLSRWIEDRHCVLRGQHEIESGTYTFNQLTVAPGAELNVPPSADGTCGGYAGHNDSGGDLCLLGGGCLTLVAHRMNVSGEISVNAQSDSALRANCGGGSGGDLVIISDHLKVDQGSLRANGSDGRSWGLPTGGGAAGHIKIYSEDIELINGLIEARGGAPEGSAPDPNNVFNREGAGPGGSGGSGYILGGTGGGAGAGGAGEGGGGGIEDPMRALEIIGHLKLDASSSVTPHNGRGELDGYVIFGGQSALRELFPQSEQLTQQAYPLVIRVKDEEGRGLPTTQVTLSLMRDQQAEYTYNLGETDEYGWMNVDRVVTLPQEGYRYLLRAQSAQARSIYLSYSDGSTECTRAYPLTEERALISNFATCAERVIDCEMGCEAPPVHHVTDLPCADTIEECPTITWVNLEGGMFRMGANRSRQNERPEHDVNLSSFWMMQHEITVAQYRACVESGHCEAPLCSEASVYCNYAYQRDEHPVNYVTWGQLRSFGDWVGGDLPTESQWEYAARQQGDAKLYPWGDDLPTCDYVNAFQVQDGLYCRTLETSPVCSFPLGHSPQGICDLIGNVSEFVLDRYKDNYNNVLGDGSARCEYDDCTPPEENTNRVVRGSSHLGELNDLRSARRSQSHHNNAQLQRGGRLVRSTPP